MTAQEFENLSFEEALSRLETIVRDLESGRIKLDDAVEAYEKAVQLKKFCESRLKAAQLKIETIEKNGDGDLVLQPLDKTEE
jgi:exodeoxyribonuclease VII small subunit